jgi:hypothetical protein
MIEVAIRQLLINDTATAAIIADRAWLGFRPQDERRPGIVISLIASNEDLDYDGPSGAVEGRIDLNCLAPTYAIAKSLALAARAKLNGWSGTQDGTCVGYIKIENMRDIPVAPLVGAGVPASFGVGLDALFLFTE